MPVYATRAGDTPLSVARRFSLPVEELCRLNGLDDTKRLTEGLALYLPETRVPRRALELLGCAYEPLPGEHGRALRRELSWWAGEDAHEETAEGAAPLLLRAAWDTGKGWSAEAAHRLLTAGDTAEELANAVQDSFRGLYLLFGAVYPFDAPVLSAFAAALAERLHAAGRYLFLGLDAEAEELYPAAAGADRVVLLSPAQAPSGALPRPNAPLAALADQLERALGQLPAGQLLLGLSGYGTVWAGSRPAPLPHTAAAHLAVASGAPVRWDPEAGECSFCCLDALGQPRTVWFQDLRSLRARLELADALGLAGLALQPAPLPNASWRSWLRANYEIKDIAS